MTPAKLNPGPDLLDDLCSRFILNVPASELESFDKFMFLVEQAHWFYEDYCRDRDQALRSLSLKEFTSLLFGHCPGLSTFRYMLDDIYHNFNKYKQSVPTMGAIILEPKLKKVLLVRGISPSHGWGFPKGKVAKDEADYECAAREVKEETGLDIMPYLNKEDYIEVHMGLKGDIRIRQQRSKLFIICGIEETTCFCPTVKGEIGGFAWHLVDNLPATSEAAKQIYQDAKGGRVRFHMVSPFIKQLRAWIKGHRRREVQRSRAKPGNCRDCSVHPDTHHRLNGIHLDRVLPSVEHSKATNSKAAPGDSWLNFRFDHNDVLQHLRFTVR